VVADMVKAKQQPNEHIWTELVNSCASTSAPLPARFHCAIAGYVLTLEVCVCVQHIWRRWPDC
jgi:hypothetical protein